MNRQQRTAYAAPCFEAEECAGRHYYRRHGILSVGLTANVGLE